MRASSRARWAVPGGYERLGSPGSKPCRTSKAPRAKASARFARTPTGTPMRLRREIGSAGPTATTSPSGPRRSARLPARRSSARFEGQSTVTECPRRRSSRATPATWSFTSCGCDQENGVTRQMRRPIRVRVYARRLCLRGPRLHRLACVGADAALRQLARLVVSSLLRRRLHQVRAGCFERPGHAVVQRELREPYRVDDDPGRVRRIPDLELQLDVHRYVAEGGALHADVRPLAVGQPRHVVRGSDVDVALADVVVEHRGDRVRLRDLLGFEAVALEHVEEVGVAADVQLHRAVEMDAAVSEERGQDPVRDGGADLRLDVVADDGYARLLEAALPVGLARDEDRHAVDHR